MRVEGGDWANLDAYIHETLPLSVLQSLGRGRSAETLASMVPLCFEPTRQVLTYRLTAFSTNIPVKLFVLCLTFMFRFV